jgi:hypothetical protein
MTLPIPPQRKDGPAVFADHGDTFMAALPAFEVRMEAIDTHVTILEAAAAASATAANAKAVEAAASAVIAVGATGAAVWVSGTTYAFGDVRWSPINGLVYRRMAAGSSALDPSSDVGVWAPLSPVVNEVDTPTNASPVDGTTNLYGVGNLVAGTFYSLYGATHAASQWQVSTSADFTTPLYSSGDQAAASTFSLPLGTLLLSTLHYWRVRYKNSSGTYSYWSKPTTFTTGATFASVAAPTITSPAAAAVLFDGPALTLTSSAFAWLGWTDTHLNSDWQLATDAAFTTIVQSASASATYKTSWTTAVAVGTTYYARVRHRGVANGVGQYSPTLSFSTDAAFNSYIATPAATPAAFGDAFEGGFYTGLIWNEVCQSTTNSAIATGSKTFTVPSMVSVPLFYAGQTLEIRSRANPANRMAGTVTRASGTSLILSVTSVGGSGNTLTDWSVMAKYRIIVCPKASGEALKALKTSDALMPRGCATLSEGRKSTLLMLAAGNAAEFPAAYWCAGLTIGAKSDWYIPARDELELCQRNLKPGAESNSTAARQTAQTFDYKTLGSYGDTSAVQGTNVNSYPVGGAYAAASPAQVAAGKNFRTGESEAFVYNSYGNHYWSSSIYNDYIPGSGFGGGYSWRSYIAYSGQANHMESVYNNNGSGYVRAVRRSII